MLAEERLDPHWGRKDVYRQMSAGRNWAEKNGLESHCSVSGFHLVAVFSVLCLTPTAHGAWGPRSRGFGIRALQRLKPALSGKAGGWSATHYFRWRSTPGACFWKYCLCSQSPIFGSTSCLLLFQGTRASDSWAFLKLKMSSLISLQNHPPQSLEFQCFLCYARLCQLSVFQNYAKISY